MRLCKKISEIWKLDCKCLAYTHFTTVDSLGEVDYNDAQKKGRRYYVLYPVIMNYG